ncbi:MAG: hypothetical protein JWL81_3498 [Verrucomicrobiales bacterium]|nr:hypothetical protein [Verrucomicrobiales bacterium]
MKNFLKRMGMGLLKALLGVRLVDQRTGAELGRVVVIRWRGRLRFIGLEGKAVRPHFLPQESETYWAQDLGFSTHPDPDFPHVDPAHRPRHASDSAGGGGDGGGMGTS